MIDLMSNITFTEAQINKRLLRIEHKTYNLRAETVLNRIGTGVALGKRPQNPDEVAAMDNFNAFMGTMETYATQARADNQLLKETLAYEVSQRRLDRYVLLEGQVGQEATDATFDQETGELLTEALPFIPHHDPVDEFVEANVYDDQGDVTGTESIRNPVVVLDESERASAQATINGADQAVIDLVVLRGAT